MNYKEKNVKAGPFPYVNPAEDVIPVIAQFPWIHRDNNEWQPPTERDFEWLAECGFNSAIILSTTVNDVIKAIGIAKNAGIKCILEQYYHMDNEKMKTFVSNAEILKNLAGILLKEEPKYSWIAADGQVREMYNWLISNNIGKMVFLCLAYSMAADYVGPDAKDYGSYLSTVQSRFNPPLWAYNYNPVITKGGSTYATLDSFYAALGDYAAIAKSTSTRFWAYCNCDSLVKSGHSRPAPSPGMLRLEAFSALAFGAQGIVFRNYAQPVDTADGSYVTAPVNRRRERTDLWYTVQSVISEIARYSPVFLGCSVIEKKFMTQNASGSGSPLLNMGGPVNALFVESGKGALVTNISNGGFNYMVIVSRDPFHSQDIRILYKTGYLTKYETVEMTPNFMEDGLMAEPAAGSQPTYTRALTLSPGGYAIIRWKMA